ncbi:hypothetical protein IW261DRAFT_1620664 [Armillaria novae-zelandiae]|uniref:F-box domain-containing protein n=1 Tax=Armillaria novae-zelandiae TaxID=153914 RepID=A0AA39PWD1_9AGAR|nr:hypothetical protein IW261DRAFT_1620664 [Armillaria novae-zelandiae]
MSNADEPKEKPLRRTRGRRGRLQGLMDMPLDIWLEIFEVLHPLDLLHLARSTKHLRSVLMSRSLSAIWKNARLSSDFPEPMPGLSEPVWVSLLFEPNCHFCVKGTVHTVDFTFRVRVCGNCAEQQIISHRAVLPLHVLFDLQDETTRKILACLPTRRSSRKPFKGLNISLRREYEEVKAHYLTLSSDQRKVYREERRAFIAEIAKHVQIGEAWQRQRICDREKELEQVRVDRAEAISKKLIDLGYEQDLESIKAPDSFHGHRLVRQPRALTERGWSNISRDIIEFIEKMRSKRLDREHTALINSRKAIAASLLRTYKLSSSGTPYTSILPTVVDFYNFGPVKDLLELPDRIIVDEPRFAPIVPQIDAFCQTWRERIHDELVYIVGHPDPSSLQTIEDKVAFLKLARNVFSCDGECSFSWAGATAASELYYPQVLAHRCSVTEWDPHEDDPQDEALSLSDMRRRCAWTAKHLSLHNKASVMVSSFIEALDRDPEQTTIDDLDNLEQLYRCLPCEHNGFFSMSPTVVSGWRAFVNHYCDEHAFDSGSCLTLTADKDFEVIPIDHESIDPKCWNSYQERMGLSDFRWRCLRCRDLSPEIERCHLPGLKMHYRTKHPDIDIDTLAIDRDYYEDFGVPPRIATVDIQMVNLTHVPNHPVV